MLPPWSSRIQKQTHWLHWNTTGNKRIDIRYRYVGNFFVDVNILKDLNFRATWYADISKPQYTWIHALQSAIQPRSVPHPIPFLPRIFSQRSGQGTTDTKNFQQDYILTHKNRFGDHPLTAMGGFYTHYSSFEQGDWNLESAHPGRQYYTRQ